MNAAEKDGAVGNYIQEIQTRFEKDMEQTAGHPYGNTFCVAEVQGQEILDALELACRAICAEASDSENAMGENGGFLQVSGLAFKVDTSVELLHSLKLLVNSNMLWIFLPWDDKIKQCLGMEDK